MAVAKPDYVGESLAACCGSKLHLWRPKLAVEVDDKVVTSERSLRAAVWNRNNKVVAAGASDGTIELRYSNGALMSILPKDNAAPIVSGQLKCLSWSMGSKRLAAGNTDGTVHVHDMISKVRPFCAHRTHLRFSHARRIHML